MMAKLSEQELERQRGWVIRAMSECQAIGDAKFLKKYERTWANKFLVHDGLPYPAKALWTAALSHGQQSRDKIDAADHLASVRALKRLGFTSFITTKRRKAAEAELEAFAEEGARQRKEASFLKRSAALVAFAKARFPAICQACGFDFEKTYGERGRGYIECHHVNPLNGREGISAPTEIRDLAMLCSNCHRMVHRTKECLTIPELEQLIGKQNTTQ